MRRLRMIPTRGEGVDGHHAAAAAIHHRVDIIHVDNATHLPGRLLLLRVLSPLLLVLLLPRRRRRRRRRVVRSRPAPPPTLASRRRTTARRIPISAATTALAPIGLLGNLHGQQLQPMLERRLVGVGLETWRRPVQADLELLDHLGQFVLPLVGGVPIPLVEEADNMLYHFSALGYVAVGLPLAVGALGDVQLLVLAATRPLLAVLLLPLPLLLLDGVM